jgi:hypothetical protein
MGTGPTGLRTLMNNLKFSLLAIFLLFLCAGTASAEFRHNPYTGKPDYYEAGGGGGSGNFSGLTLTGDSGTNQDITNGDTIDVEGGTGINTVVTGVDKVIVNIDADGVSATELKDTDTPSDEEIYTYEATGTTGEWHSIDELLENTFSATGILKRTGVNTYSADALLDASDLGTDSVSADELNATGVESELEAVLDLQDLQGAVVDSQVPDNITVDLATTATTANAGDSATAFFSSGTIEHERGGLEADISGYGNGLLGTNGTATIDVDTVSEFSTALGITGSPSSSTYLRGDGTWGTPAGGGGSSEWTDYGTYLEPNEDESVNIPQNLTVENNLSVDGLIFAQREIALPIDADLSLGSSGDIGRVHLPYSGTINGLYAESLYDLAGTITFTLSVDGVEKTTTGGTRPSITSGNRVGSLISGLSIPVTKRTSEIEIDLHSYTNVNDLTMDGYIWVLIDVNDISNG